MDKNRNYKKSSKYGLVYGAIFGFAVGDALGLPVEFMSRDQLKLKPMTGMRGFGSHLKPLGTWSDDTSLTLCTMDSLCEGLDYLDMMNKFLDYYEHGKYAAQDVAFDADIITSQALWRFSNGIPPLECGSTLEKDNGNGSLGRILPLLFYLKSKYPDFINNKGMDIIHKVSSLTHGHTHSKLACGIYLSIASMLCNSKESILKCVIKGAKAALDYYARKEENTELKAELGHFYFITTKYFYRRREYEIKSTSNVVETLEAVLWCLVNSHSYKSCVLKAVNLGGDTDTIAAIAGGLAGIYYGYKDIPKKWINTLVRAKAIEEMCNKFNHIYENKLW